MSRFIVSMLFCSLPLFAQAQAPVDPFEGLAAEMTPEERAAAGIGDLSPSQQQFLDAWLRKRFETEPTVVGAPPLEPGESALVSGGASEAAAQAQAIEAEVERRVAEELAAAKAVEAEDEKLMNEPFEAMVTGSFSGWNGKTVFALDNGQVWRQRTGSSRYRHTRGDSKVRFKRSFIGLWTMTVLSTGRSVGVRRID